MKNMTPQHMRCAPLHCPSVQELADKRLRIVGRRDGSQDGATDGEIAIIIDRDLLEDVFKAWLTERSAMVAEAWK